ncbi:hypothetical protein IWZ03DRAFT_96142 [Phyllosticta citriasiana]|uniref:Uncharacterized protein n=1 Tax=Phyllosticta citriasiana TaxID=595635 RepID=A0ABR1KV37_9PEZI
MAYGAGERVSGDKILAVGEVSLLAGDDDWQTAYREAAACVQSRSHPRRLSLAPWSRSGVGCQSSGGWRRPERSGSSSVDHASERERIRWGVGGGVGVWDVEGKVQAVREDVCRGLGMEGDGSAWRRLKRQALELQVWNADVSAAGRGGFFFGRAPLLEWRRRQGMDDERVRSAVEWWQSSCRESDCGCSVGGKKVVDERAWVGETDGRRRNKNGSE